MSSLKKKSLLLLMAMIVLIAIPMSFASDVDDQLAVDDDSDIISVTDDIDQISDVDSENELGSTPVPDNGAFVYMGTDSATIDDGTGVTISGEIRYGYGAGGSDVITGGNFPVTCTYEDASGDIQTYSTTTTTNGKFTFDTSTFIGLSGRDTPYSLTISATDDSSGTASMYSGSSTILSATYTLTINEPEPVIPGVDDVASKVDAAGDGDVIDLSDYDVYDFVDGSLTIAKSNITLKGNGDTVIKGHGVGNGLFYITGSNVTIQGIHFVDTNPNNNFTYGGSTNGWGVNFRSVEGGLVKDCNFTDFNSAVVVQGSTDVVIEDNFFNGGYTTVIANDPTVNVEKGSKSLNIYRQSSKITVRGNTFEGPILDGVSIAQGSGSNIVENNTFIGNTYSIYFGGSSTKNSIIRNNKFINCGYFKEGDVEWDKLPVISIQKASNDIAIENNNFTALTNSVLIAAEQGNEAHGFPSSLGNINVTGNQVDLAADVDGRSVVLFHVLCRDDTELNLFAPLKVDDNTLASGVREYVVWYTAWGEEVAVLDNTAADIQAAIDAAEPGAVIDLTAVPSFDFGDDGITIAKDNITLKGDNTRIIGNGVGNGLFYITGSNVTIQGFDFVDVNPSNIFVYGGSVNGWGVNMRGVTGGLISDCTFTNFGSAVVVQGSTDVVIENNMFTGGYTTVIANDPTVNVEKGSKSLNIYRQSSKITVRNNTFEGPILDGVSIAQGSGSNIVENNTFIGNTYSIYFGGSSTKNSVIRNNKFINCGYFKEGDIVWTELPVISIQKAANDISIVDNDFVALDNSVLIAAEQGNEAHGFPSSLGNINVTGNNVTLANGASKAYNIVLFSIYCRNGDLNLSAPINVSGNVLADNVKAAVVETTGDKVFDVETPVELIGTAITASPITIKAGNNGNLKITLKDQNGNPIANDLIVVQVDGEPLFIGPTDANGVVNVPVKYASATTKFAYISYVDTTGKYLSSLETVKITVVKKATTLTAKKATLKVKKAKKVKVTLKSEGKALAKKVVTIKVNKKTFKAKTNAKGVATIKVKVTKKGKFTATVKFAGDGAYKAVTKKVKIKVKK